jgi:hypothetical protein
VPLRSGCCCPSQHSRGSAPQAMCRCRGTAAKRGARRSLFGRRPRAPRPALNSHSTAARDQRLSSSASGAGPRSVRGVPLRTSESESQAAGQAARRTKHSSAEDSCTGADQAAGWQLRRALRACKTPDGWEAAAQATGCRQGSPLSLALLPAQQSPGLDRPGRASWAKEAAQALLYDCDGSSWAESVGCAVRACGKASWQLRPTSPCLTPRVLARTASLPRTLQYEPYKCLASDASGQSERAAASRLE